MERTNLTDDDTGKTVVNSMGNKVGIVSEVNGDVASVNPDPGLADTISSKLGLGNAGEGDYELPEDRVHTITRNEIQIKD